MAVIRWQSWALHRKPRCDLRQFCHDKPLFIARTIDQNYVNGRTVAREAVGKNKRRRKGQEIMTCPRIFSRPSPASFSQRRLPCPR
jgi:hypothetical protein